MKDKAKYWAFRAGEAIVVFRYGKSGNDKITASKLPIVQQYTFTDDQYRIAVRSLTGGEKVRMNEFFTHDKAACFSCPFRKENGGGCYTHKFHSWMSFLNVLRGVYDKYGEDIPELDDQMTSEILAACANTYVRFGTYGEPVVVPIRLVEAIAEISSNWTGYTHRWREEIVAPYMKYFMASTEDRAGNFLAMAMGLRVYFATKGADTEGMVNCPASAEAGYKTNCHACGLCKGTSSKAKSIFIIQH